MADGYGGEQIPPGRRIEIAVTSETTLKGIHMGKSLDRPGDWATLQVPDIGAQVITDGKIHKAFEALVAKGAALGTAVYATSDHPGGSATYYFSPANGALAQAFGAAPSTSGPPETRRAFIAGDNHYAATLFTPSGGTDSAG
ncbi:hypothetical protein [Burkholderia gladioli]|nr:hypothetical protein [Burkholderia gladioli]MDN7497939.1 hypothetical protein [Burkholderia gladioli]